MRPDDTKQLLELVVIDPAVRFGKPTLRGTRLTVADVLELAATTPPDERATDYPQITEDAVRACMLHAAGLVKRQDEDIRDVRLAAAEATWHQPSETAASYGRG